MPVADVYQGERIVAHFDRDREGVRLTFLPDIELARGQLATTIPIQNFLGQELPAFFLNLLPEGARLRLLLENSRSKDDALALLVRVGWDTIGDVSVVPHGVIPESRSAAIAGRGLAESDFWDLFYEGIGDRPDNSIPGVQEKISASTVAFGLRSPGVPSAILKLNPPKYPFLVHNEAFFMRMAKACGLDVCATEIVYDRRGELGLLVRRFDRIREKGAIRKLHQEDGCQLLNTAPANKYYVSLREVVDAVTLYSSSPVVEAERILRQVAFSYLIGNSDLHAKNISLLWQDLVRVSPVYDMLSTLPYPSLDRNMALKMHGKDDNFRRGDFVEFGLLYGLAASATETMIEDLCSRAEPWAERVTEIGFTKAESRALGQEIRERIGKLWRP